MNDKFSDLFLAACRTNGKHLVGEAEWTAFFHSIIAGGLINTTAEAKDIETIWLERVTTSRAFSSSTDVVQEPTLTFEVFQDRILDSHPVPSSKAAITVSSSIKQKALNLASLLNDQDPSTFDEEKTRQLLSVMHELEKEHIKMTEKTQKLTDDIGKSLDMTSLKALTTGTGTGTGTGGARLDDDDEEEPASGQRATTINDLPNPIIFFNTNLALIEKAAIKHKVRSVRFSHRTSNSRGRVSRDIYNFGQNFTDINDIHVYKCQGTNKGKLIDVTALVCPKTKVPPAALAALWHCYSAHKGLSLASTCVPHAIGIDEDENDLMFFYELIAARSLSSMLHDKRLSNSRYLLREESVLFRHWAREILIALSQLHEQSASILLNAHDIGPENVMLARQGTSARLGRLLWGPTFDANECGYGVKQFFRERECALLKGFGKILRALLSNEEEKEAIGKFCPSRSVTIGVGKLLALMEEGGGGGEGDSPLILPISIVQGQRLVVKLPPVNSLRAVQGEGGGGKLGQHVKWHRAICSNVSDSAAEEDGTSRSPIITVLKEGSTTHFTKTESGRTTNETLNVDSMGNASIVLLATGTGFCEVKIPFYDPTIDAMPATNCSVTIAVEICKVPCSSTLQAILIACKDSSSEVENFTTLRSLLDHKFFEPLGVGDLANVMGDYEVEFVEHNKKKRDVDVL